MMTGKISLAGLALLGSLLVMPAIAQPLGSQPLKQNSSSTSLQRQGSSSPRSCQAAVAEAKRRLEAVGNLEVTVEQREIEQLPAHLRTRPYDYVFLLEGAAFESVMNSPVMMRNLAASVIQSCNSVGEVNFASAHSGWRHVFGLFPNGRVEAFRCAEEFGMEVDHPWGYYFCSL